MLRFHVWLLLSLGNAFAFASEPGVLCDLAMLVSLFLTTVVDSVGIPGKSWASLEVKSVLSHAMTRQCQLPPLFLMGNNSPGQKMASQASRARVIDPKHKRVEHPVRQSLWWPGLFSAQGIGNFRDGVPGQDQARPGIRLVPGIRHVLGMLLLSLAGTCLTKVHNRQMAFGPEGAEPPPLPAAAPAQTSARGWTGVDRPPAPLSPQRRSPLPAPLAVSLLHGPGLEGGALTCFYRSCL